MTQKQVIDKYDYFTEQLLNFEKVRSSKVSWKSKEMTLRFDNRADLLAFAQFFDLLYAIVEDINEEEERKENNQD